MALARGPRARAQLAFEALSIEGGLLSPEWLARVAQLAAGQQSEADYRVPKGLNLRDEIGRYWRIAQAHWDDFAAGLSTGGWPDDVDRRRALAERFVARCCATASASRRSRRSRRSSSPVAAIRSADAALGGRVPVVVAAAGEGVESASRVVRRRRPAAQRVRPGAGVPQRADGALGASSRTVSSLRIVRDNASLTRPAWIRGRPPAHLHRGALRGLRRALAARARDALRPSDASEAGGRVRARDLARRRARRRDARARAPATTASRRRCSRWARASCRTRTTRRCARRCRTAR